MTYRERLKIVMAGEIPDRVPVCPDISNMVPAQMTGKPFWDVYVKEDPPLWKAYIDAVKFFGIDGGFEMCGIDPCPDPDEEDPGVSRIVCRFPDESFATQDFNSATNDWSRYLILHTADNPPAYRISPDKLGLPQIPSTWEEITGVKQWPKGLELWRLVRKEMGEHGVVGTWSGPGTCVVGSPEDIYEYYDNPRKFHEKRDRMMSRLEGRMERIAAMTPEDRPDVLYCGGSGSLIWQTPEMFRELALPGLKKVTEMAFDLGIPTHVHSCGPEAEMVKMAALETKLTIIDPLEIPPMGNCNLAELKRLYGDKITLKGNLHTTEVMLRGTVSDVVEASKKAIDDAAKGGRFILSTGDQCGRDTPFKNLNAMVETARTYGKY
jgi:uroporphyrinogen decarboxylase